jgi:hypothetical protein
MAAPDAINRVASHRPRTVVASTSKPSTPAISATRRTVRAGSTALLVEKLTANEDDGIWRLMVVLFGYRFDVRG